jgi:hypothetical protein
MQRASFPILFLVLAGLAALSSATCSLPTFTNFNPASYTKTAQQHGSKSYAKIVVQKKPFFISGIFLLSACRSILIHQTLTKVIFVILSTVCIYWGVNAGIARLAVAAPTTGWVGMAILRNSSWDSTDAIIGTVIILFLPEGFSLTLNVTFSQAVSMTRRVFHTPTIIFVISMVTPLPLTHMETLLSWIQSMEELTWLRAAGMLSRKMAGPFLNGLEVCLSVNRLHFVSFTDAISGSSLQL